MISIELPAVHYLYGQVTRMIYHSVSTDGFLEILHTLLLMDDMVTLAVSKEMCLRKLSVLNYCQEYGMV